MFEKTKPISAADAARFSEVSGVDGARHPANRANPADSAGAADGPVGAASEPAALRKLEWGELSARLSAARDLRLLLRSDVSRELAGSDGGFADEAARYFRARKHYEPDVNPVALERFKGSQGTTQISDRTDQGLHQDEACVSGHAITGDREKIDD